jgi:hypothetical protein
MFNSSAFIATIALLNFVFDPSVNVLLSLFIYSCELPHPISISLLFLLILKNEFILSLS